MRFDNDKVSKSDLSKIVYFQIMLCFDVVVNIYNIHTQDLVEALKALSTFFTDNNLRERRNLRGDIEKRSLYVNEQFESAFRDVKQVCYL